jgi:transposase InsO family protein
MILELIDEAVTAGARLQRACDIMGLSLRTLQRWRQMGEDGGEDRRRTTASPPENKLSETERCRVLALVNSPEFRDLPPKQIVGKLADKGIYVASESTMYRLLREAKQNAHRHRSKPPESTKPPERVATGPAQVLSWDITYLPAPVRGTFYYLYMFQDIWSRKIVGWEVHECEDNALAADLLIDVCGGLGVDPSNLYLHSDNGSPMKGATMLATIRDLGVTASYSRPGVSDDSPFIESLFRTMKYRPAYPDKPFSSIEEARQWVTQFVEWYNYEHLHSTIGFVTPHDRHTGRDIDILAARRALYKRARAAHPERWSADIRKWDRPTVVRLNPARTVRLPKEGDVKAA